jgi:hypothetical protein
MSDPYDNGIGIPTFVLKLHIAQGVISSYLRIIC